MSREFHVTPNSASLSDLPVQVNRALERGAVVVTPMERVSRHCLARYDALQQSRNAAAWQAPQVYSWNAWVNSLWNNAVVRGVENRVLLNSVQEHALWRQVLAEQMQASSAQVRLCLSAMRLLGTYDVHARYQTKLSEPATSNEKTFAAWFQRYEEHCGANNYLLAAFAELELARHVLSGRLQGAAEYVLYGFRDLTPAQQTLLNALRSAGSRVGKASIAVPQTKAPSVLRCADAQSESRACAVWARERLQEDSAATITIIVPDLDQAWPEMERELRAAIAPELSDITHGEQPPRFEVSSGRPLNRIPMMTDALRLLRWCVGDLSVEEAGMLLRSPRLALASSPERGAELDAFVLRDAALLRAEVSLSSAARLLGRHDEIAAQKLDAIASLARSSQRVPATYAAWAQNVTEILQAAGWACGELNSEEYQAVDRWNDALDRLATLDLFGHRVPFASAIQELTVIASEMFFLRENAGAPVQVVAWHASAGATSDALWFLHADEHALHGRRTLHSYLPLALQRELGMPGVHPASDEQATRLALEQLVEGAGNAVFSYASANAEGIQRMSPLLEQLAETWGATHDTSMPPAVSELDGLVEFLEDGTPLPPLPDGVVMHGGVDVITKQSQCPFRAFAEHRLFATTPERQEAGYRGRDRGDHVHTVLSAFWNEVGDHATLVEYSRTYAEDGQTRRDALLTKLIRDLYKDSANAWEAAYRQVQRERLFQLLSTWLDFEAQRTPFEVTATEQEVVGANLGPLLLNLRVDRVDTPANDERAAKLLIDYKTGPAEQRDWFGERPDQPQLPVYAVASGLDQVEAIAFAKIRARDKDRGLKGCATGENSFGVQATKNMFDEEFAGWQAALVSLATAYAEGDTSVTPKDYPTICEFCGQRMLCRVEEQKPIEVDDPDEIGEVLE